MITLHLAEAEDVDDMARVQVKSLREQGEEHYNEDQLEFLAPADYGPELVSETVFEDDDKYAVVAEQDGEFAGFAVLHTSDGYLAGVFVDPDYAGTGIGTALVEDVEQQARGADVETLTVITALNAIRFYETVGFTRVEETEVSGEATTVPAVKMKKDL